MWLIVFRVVIWMLLGLVCWLNLQPWMMVGDWLVATGLEVPFMPLLVRVPVLGSILQGMLLVAGHLFAVGLWLVVQTFQVMALIADNPGVQNAFAKLFRGFPLSQWISQNSKVIGRLGWAGYVVEASVCMLTYPPYGNGFSDLISDMGAWDPYLISWGDLTLFMLTILMFEGCVWLACFFYGAITMTGQTTHTMPRQ